MKDIYIVFIWDADKAKAYHLGKAFQIRKHAIEYADMCNEEYTKAGIKRIAHIETLELQDI